MIYFEEFPSAIWLKDRSLFSIIFECQSQPVERVLFERSGRNLFEILSAENSLPEILAENVQCIYQSSMKDIARPKRWRWRVFIEDTVSQRCVRSALNWESRFGILETFERTLNRTSKLGTIRWAL